MCSMLLLISYAKCGDIVIGMNVFDMIPLAKTTFPGLLHEAMNIFFLSDGSRWGLSLIRLLYPVF